MSLQTNLTNLATRLSTQAKALKILINGNAADLSGLATTEKSNLVAAINEVVGSVGEGGGAAINDTGTSTSSVWSSSKTNTEILAKVSALVDSAPGALDTLNELAAALGDDPNFAATLTTALAGKAPISHSHGAGDLPAASLTQPGISEAATNAETATGTDPLRYVTVAGLRSVMGDPETDLVAVFEAGLI